MSCKVLHRSNSMYQPDIPKLIAESRKWDNENLYTTSAFLQSAKNVYIYLYIYIHMCIGISFEEFNDTNA